MTTPIAAESAPEARPDVDDADLQRLLQALRDTCSEVSRVVLGQDEVISQMLVSLIAGGHVLLEGPPGVGKTLLARTLGAATGMSFARIQFTPDLMPADITGSMVLVPDESGRNRLEFQKGPIFTQLLLADEINRATPRTQSALLEAMQEQTVSTSAGSFDLPRPFLVLATQNPIEMEGTYSLPEAQIDRFLFRIDIAYPTETVLASILHSTTGVIQEVARQVLTPDEIVRLQTLVRTVPMADHVRKSVARFALRTQPKSPLATPEVDRYVRVGLSPRGAQAVVLAAKGHALIAGRYNVSFDDIRAVLGPATRHRVQLNYEGRADGIDIERKLVELLDASIA
jgi:MoxR-like ATPase